jgi:hypothetical protein
LLALATVIAIAVVFFVGFGASVYWSLRSSEVKVPDVVGKDRFVAENELTGAGLNFRVRAVRPSNQVKTDSILFQLPRAGEVVKAGQTVAVDVSRQAKEGEASDAVNHGDNTNTNTNSDKPSENVNANAAPAGNLNENKPKRTRNTNSTANGNGNANGNANAGNRNANSNKPKPNANASNGNANASGNANRSSNRSGETNNQNSNRPKPNTNRATPPAQPTPHK